LAPETAEFLWICAMVQHEKQRLKSSVVSANHDAADLEASLGENAES
jgi:hypothetical protein